MFDRSLVGGAFQAVGFGLIVAGLWLWSVPAALVVSGTLIFVAGGLEAARAGRSRPKG